eukprot:2613376-Pleurochrysis_carterae.AAC.3
MRYGSHHALKHKSAIGSGESKVTAQAKLARGRTIQSNGIPYITIAKRRQVSCSASKTDPRMHRSAFVKYITVFFVTKLFCLGACGHTHHYVISLISFVSLKIPRQTASKDLSAALRPILTGKYAAPGRKLVGGRNG